MTVVKDDEVATAEEGSAVNEVAKVEDNNAAVDEVAKAEDKDDLDIMTDSNLPDWSIIGSKGLDNEGSDGESVEVIPCEEEKSEADSHNADGAPQNELAVETHEKIMQTEEIVLFRNLTIWHPGVIALSIICHLVICLVFYSANDVNELPDLITEPLPDRLRPAMREVLEDWQQMSTRTAQEKTKVLSFFNNYFPFDEYHDELIPLFEKDMMLDPTMASFHKKRVYQPRPPPSVQQMLKSKRTVTMPPRNSKSAQYQPDPPKVFSEHKSQEPPNKNSENTNFDCSTCKKYSSDCKKFCKHNKGKNLKYYYDKYIDPVVKKFPNFKNKF